MTTALLFTACHDDDVVIDEQVTGPTEMTVMSFNVLFDDPDNQYAEHNWRSRRNAVLTMINQENPDIMCLQESMWNQMLYLADKLTAYDYVDQNVDGNDNASGLHNTIFYNKDKYTLIDNGNYWLSSQPGGLSYPWNAVDRQRRVAVWAHLKDNKTKAHFFVFNTQLNNGDTEADQDARERSSKLNVEQMEDIVGSDSTVVICGDMYASYAISDTKREALTPYYDWMKSLRDDAPDTDNKYSFNNFDIASANVTSNHDHIFVRNATPLKFRTLDGNYGVDYISDHYPIVSTIRIEYNEKK